MPASTILLLESEPTIAESIAKILSDAGYTVTVATASDDAFAKAADHQLLILGTVVTGRSPRSSCAGRSGPRLRSSAVPVMCVSATEDVEERISFLEAGADDVMARTFDARELEARVEALLLRFQRSRGLTPIVSTDGVTMHRARRTVAVYSPKGGVGTTTIATNIAIAAVARRPDRVVLVDLALQFGGVATLLNLDPKQTLADVVRDEASLREPELLRTYAMRHDSGLHVLAAPAAPEAAETVTPAHVTQILRTLLEGYDMVVVDAGSTLDERALAIFEAAEQVILPITPEIGALKAMHALIEYLGEAGSVGLKSIFVLNDIFAREILKATRRRDLPRLQDRGRAAVRPVPVPEGGQRGRPDRHGRAALGPGGAAGPARLDRLRGRGLHAPAAAEKKRSGGLFRRRR